MMKILVFGISSQRGGVESFLLNYLQAFHSQFRDCSFHFVVIDNIPSFLSDAVGRCDSIHVVPTRLKHPFLFCSALQRAIADIQPDIVWYNVCTLSDITLPVIAHTMGIPVVFHSHNSSNMGTFANHILHLMHKKIVGLIGDVFLACSDTAADFMYPSSVAKSAQIIPNAIDVSKFAFNVADRNLLRKNIGCSDGIVFGHVGRFHPQKNHEFLISVFKQIHEKYPSSLLLLLGDGSGENDIRLTVESLGLQESVIFAGSVCDIYQYYSAMDCFLLPSLYEGFPMCLVEAQASGLQCFVSDSITRSVAFSEQVAFLPIDDPSIWSDAVFDVVLHHACNRSSAARIVEMSGYDIVRAASKMYSVFLSLCR